ncbi:carboxypeptidase-like regulatory domain-containing protein [Nocardioides houyundeii]|uniref:carboxypeptidase-like regulatory domain-containing protein n=1 Tax=Nocardioides houyundeii TaxID=2045452 RepID=UPI000C761958|nr:carboxypeptidase-like regulatory domain-containing protein [Nocardioides houyundeii]
MSSRIRAPWGRTTVGPTALIVVLPILVVSSLLTTTAVAQVEEPPLQSVSGTIIDSDGRPLADAEVTFSGERVSQGYHQLTTDRQGRFSLDLPAGTYNGTFAKGGYATKYLLPGGPLGPVVVGSDPVALDVILLRLAVLAGRVEGPDGPVAGAQVTAYRKYPDGSWGSDASSTSDQEGGYRMIALPRAPIV